MTAVKTRFCPSPSGYMHLGNARTALFNALLAMHHQSCFLLRIEDTDATRSCDEYIEGLQDDLQWLGLVWQEGIDVGGEYGPYQQSQRQSIYDEYYAQLEQQGKAYPCFCSEQQLALSRKLQRGAGQAPRYLGTCAALSTDEIAAKRAEGLPSSLRFKLPRGEMVTFSDLVKGEQRFATDDMGDFIIRRGDGTASFMFCNAIDDAVMGVTHALRGEDHLTNTPRQLLILRALGLTPPQYAHISLITGNDGSPLSKRNGSRSIRDLAAAGYLPLTVLNYLARLGHYYADNQLLSYAGLAAAFNTDNLGSSAAKFDEQQLQYWQKQALLASDDEQLWDWVGQRVHCLVPEALQAEFIALVKPNVLFPEDALSWAAILFVDNLDFSEEMQTMIAAAGSDFLAVAKQSISEHGADYAALTAALKEKLGIKGKALFQPLRAIFTGQLHGPELKQIMLLQGEQRLLHRIAQASSYVS